MAADASVPLPAPAHTREELLNTLASIATTAIEAQHLTDLEELGGHIDDIETGLARATSLAEALEWPVQP